MVCQVYIHRRTRFFTFMYFNMYTCFNSYIRGTGYSYNIKLDKCNWVQGRGLCCVSTFIVYFFCFGCLVCQRNILNYLRLIIVYLHGVRDFCNGLTFGGGFSQCHLYVLCCNAYMKARCLQCHQLYVSSFMCFTSNRTLFQTTRRVTRFVLFTFNFSATTTTYTGGFFALTQVT